MKKQIYLQRRIQIKTEKLQRELMDPYLNIIASASNYNLRIMV